MRKRKRLLNRAVSNRLPVQGGGEAKAPSKKALRKEQKRKEEMAKHEVLQAKKQSIQDEEFAKLKDHVLAIEKGKPLWKFQRWIRYMTYKPMANVLMKRLLQFWHKLADKDGAPLNFESILELEAALEPEIEVIICGGGYQEIIK